MFHLQVCKGAGTPDDSRMTKFRPPLTGPQALGNKEYGCRGGKIRKVHRKRQYQITNFKWLNYSNPFSTMQERGDVKCFHQKPEAGGQT
jgi:hypothetical protein